MPAFFINHLFWRRKIERWLFKVKLSPSACLNIGVFRRSDERRGEKVRRLASLEIS
jgi:hypothetical protein